jgi:predicted phosphodiesterase
VRLGVLTDLHAVRDVTRRAAWHNAYDFAGVEERCRRAIELFQRERVERVLVLGDIAHDGDLASMRRVLAPVTSGPPVLAVGGNHDSAQPTGQLARAAGASLRLPGWRATRTGSTKVAGLRIVRRARRRWAAARPPALATWGAELVVLASHFPVLSRREALAERGLPYAGDLVDRARVTNALVERAAPTVVACGHLHVRDSSAHRSLLQLGVGAVVEPPFEATVLEVTANGASVELSRTAHELGRAPERRNPRLVPARETWLFGPASGWRRADPRAAT